MKTLVDYRNLICAAEALATQDPRAYRMRVAALAALGIGYVVVVLAGTLLLVVGAVAAIVASKSLLLIKLAWVPLGFAYVLVRALWVKLARPPGREVRAHEAPALFAEIEKVRTALNARRVHSVILTPDFNASIAQVPRLGLLGWPRNHLVLGVPLADALSPAQFRAVLAHELGHLANNHARFGNWIYRVRRIWGELVTALEAKRSRATRLLTRFLDWYGPYFNAYSFVLARANEYEADAESARVAGANHAAAALTAVYAKGEYLDQRCWNDYYADAATCPEAPLAPFTRYLACLRSPTDGAMQSAVQSALARRTALDNTHPSLADRLAALGVPAPQLAPIERSAADVFLGPLFAQVVGETDAAWRDGVSDAWRDQHRRMTETHQKLARCAAGDAAALADDELFEYAVLTERVGDDDRARSLVEMLLARNGGHAAARFMRGRLRLASDDIGGTEDVELAMRLDETALEAGSELLYHYWYARNEIARCQPYLDTLTRLAAERQAARDERAAVHRRDRFDPHGLGPEALACYHSVLQASPRVRRAWLARKRVEHFPESPCFVLVIELGFWARPRQDELQRIVDALPDEHAHVLLNKAFHKQSWKKIRALDGALIHATGRRA